MGRKGAFMLTPGSQARFLKTLCAAAAGMAGLLCVITSEDFRSKITEVTQKIGRMMEFATKLDDPDPALRQVEKLEQERKSLLDEVRRLEQEDQAAKMIKSINEHHVRKLLQGIADNMQHMNREALKDMLASIVDRIELDPTDWTCQIHYRIGIEGRNKVASPRVTETIQQKPITTGIIVVRLRKRAR
jgi:hypothetical protein